MSQYHTSVLLQESIEGLDIHPDGTYVDVTFGGGGHSREILKHLSAKGRLIAFDQDKDALKNTIDDARFTLVNHNFRYLEHFLTYLGIDGVDGIIADLGVSSYQFDTDERGFSFRFDGELNMRMNQGIRYSAADIVNKYTAEKLEDVFRNYGEIGNAKNLVKAIIGSRPLRTTFELRDACLQCLPFKLLPRVFQALRIEVNGEMEALETLLQASAHVLKTGGRLVIISYHSLEDRMVKNFMRGREDGRAISSNLLDLKRSPRERKSLEDRMVKNFMRSENFKPISRKAIVPSAEEVNENSRARSAKLRIGERI